MQNTRKIKSQFFKFSSHSHNIFLCRKFSCISSLLGSYSMVERLKDLCLDVDDDCMEKREMLARDITEVRSAKDWQDNEIILCRLWIIVTAQNITAHWCTELCKPHPTITNNFKSNNQTTFDIDNIIRSYVVLDKTTPCQIILRSETVCSFSNCLNINIKIKTDFSPQP